MARPKDNPLSRRSKFRKFSKPIKKRGKRKTRD